MPTLAVFVTLVLGCSAFHAGAAQRPSASRAGVFKALVPAPDAMTLDGASFLVAGLREMVGLQGYGGGNAFSQSATGEAGDLNQIIALSVIFPTVVTAAFFKDSILESFEPDPYSPANPPPGWKEVPSASRPGKTSWLNTATKERYDVLPPAARKGKM